MNPGFVKVVDLLCGDGIVVWLPVLQRGENDDRHAAEIRDATSGVVDFGIAAATVGLNGAILRGGAFHCCIGFHIFHQLVSECLCDGVDVTGNLRWHVDGLIAHEEANQAKTRSDWSTPAGKLANKDGHAIDSCKHDRGFILIGIGGID